MCEYSDAKRKTTKMLAICKDCLENVRINQIRVNIAGHFVTRI